MSTTENILEYLTASSGQNHPPTRQSREREKQAVSPGSSANWLVKTTGLQVANFLKKASCMATTVQASHDKPNVQSYPFETSQIEFATATYQ